MERLPPHARGSETSRQAALSIKKDVSRLQRLILAALAASPDGLTRYELVFTTDLSLQSVCGRVNELIRADKIETRIDPDTGKKATRLSPSGRSVEICYLKAQPSS